MGSGKIIILNGSSSSGKTSIARALEQVLKEKYVYISFDEKGLVYQLELKNS